LCQTTAWQSPHFSAAVYNFQSICESESSLAKKFYRLTTQLDCDLEPDIFSTGILTGNNFELLKPLQQQGVLRH